MNLAASIIVGCALNAVFSDLCSLTICESRENYKENDRKYMMGLEQYQTTLLETKVIGK